MKTLAKVLALVAIVMFAGYNVHKAQQCEVVSDVAMANVEALAEGESAPGIYDILEEITTFAVDGEPYKETWIINCEPGGQYACREGRYWRHKFNGIWSDWFYA